MGAKKKTVKSKIRNASDFDFSKGVRGKYAKKYREGVSVTIYSPNKKVVETAQKKEMFVMIDEDIVKVFPNAKSVNSALRHLIEAVPQKTHSKKATQ